MYYQTEGPVLSRRDGCVLLSPRSSPGVTGAWSPCGFSMVETIGAGARLGGARSRASLRDVRARGARRRRDHLRTASRRLGSALGGRAPAGASSRPPRSPSLAALGELRGARDRRRRSAARCPSAGAATLPLPLAAGLYGVLLGLGFTTFVLTFAVWALGQ